jgi:hypothetical protein
MHGSLLWYRDASGASRLLGPGTGVAMLPLVRGFEVLVFLTIARLWHPELRGADKDELLNVLWPHVAEARARRRLSTALGQLRAGYPSKNQDDACVAGLARRPVRPEPCAEGRAGHAPEWLGRRLDRFGDRDQRPRQARHRRRPGARHA